MPPRFTLWGNIFLSAKRSSTCLLLFSLLYIRFLIKMCAWCVGGLKANKMVYEIFAPLALYLPRMHVLWWSLSIHFLKHLFCWQPLERVRAAKSFQILWKLSYIRTMHAHQHIIVEALMYVEMLHRQTNKRVRLNPISKDKRWKISGKTHGSGNKRGMKVLERGWREAFKGKLVTRVKNTSITSHSIWMFESSRAAALLYIYMTVPNAIQHACKCEKYQMNIINIHCKWGTKERLPFVM